ncbi:hypothetical protein Tco_0320185 [Tanacetum coccineum]
MGQAAVGHASPESLTLLENCLEECANKVGNSLQQWDNRKLAINRFNERNMVEIESFIRNLVASLLSSMKLGINESLRLANIVPGVFRRALRGIKFKETSLTVNVDAFQGFRRWKLWFPNKFFVLNTVSITLIAIAMKLPVDLTTNNAGDRNGKIVSIAFLVTMLYNFLPSLGLMNDKELLVNMVAWSILLITITVNVSIQIFAGMLPAVLFFLLLFPILWVFSIAFTVPASRRILEHRYKELHGLASYPQEIKFSYQELEHNVKKYWMMAETGNPQFAIACSEVASTFEFIGSLIFLSSLVQLFRFNYPTQYSDYNWSLKVIVGIQSSGACIGDKLMLRNMSSIFGRSARTKAQEQDDLNATFCTDAILLIEVNRLLWAGGNFAWAAQSVYKHEPLLEEQWEARFCLLANFENARVMVIRTSATSSSSSSFAHLMGPASSEKLLKSKAAREKSVAIDLLCSSDCWYFCKLLTRFKKEENVSISNVRSEMKEYAMYVLQIEDNAKLSEKISRNALKSINQLLSKSKKNEPGNLIKLLKKSTGFKGVLEFDNDQVPPLHSKEKKNSWSLVVVTLTAIVVALLNNNHVDRLIASMREGLLIVRNIEECLNADSDLVKTRRAARRVWTQVEVYRKWLQIDLQKKARDGKTLKDILKWLRDDAVQIVIQFKSCKKRRMDDSHYKFIVASSMYRVSETILIHCSELEDWPIDGQLLEWILHMIADILCACFTNLTCVIKKMCHHDAIEKREDSVRSAAQLLGRSRKILEILNTRQLPNLDVDLKADIGKWHALAKSEIPKDAPFEPDSTSFSKS